MKTLKFLMLGVSVIIAGSACDQNFLDTMPSSNIVQPQTLDDFQRILDNPLYVGRSPALPQLACDDYYFTSRAAWEAARHATERNSYIWAKDVFGGEVRIEDWNAPYAGIFYANSVLAGLENLDVAKNDSVRYREIKGSAHFIRAYTYFDLVKNFAPVYDEATAANDLGVPLRLRPEIDEVLQRATLKECYDQILHDLELAINLLTLTVPNPSRNRPSRLAAYAFASRLHLSMRHYELALAYADSALSHYDTLIDFNTVDTTIGTPFLPTNDESILYTMAIPYPSVSYLYVGGDVAVDTNLIASYHADDLRLKIYFARLPLKEGYYVKRGYNGSGLTNFTGLAVDELYLIKAECLARSGSFEEAMTVLNKLLYYRFPPEKFKPLQAFSASESLDIILLERRKTLVYRALRWDDLRRLNKEGANITLTRILDGETYTLPPNDPRYVFNIPDDEIAMSGIIQNQR